MRPSAAVLRAALPLAVPLVALVATVAAGCAQPPARGDWPAYAGDAASTHYSALDGLDADNIADLEVAWEWKPDEDAMAEFGTRPGNFQNTPLMIDDVLYVSTPYNRVVALDAESGREFWSFDPGATRMASHPTAPASSIAVWRRGEAMGASCAFS
jgi:quinoprotein glucose dehydrogenase